MAEQSFWQRLLSTVERTYERRIRAASLVQEYGAAHAEHHHEDDEAEVAVIANVPRGTRLGAHATPAPTSDRVDAGRDGPVEP